MVMVIHSSDLTSSLNAHTRQKAGAAAASKPEASSADSATKANPQATQQVQLSQQAQTIKQLETSIQQSEGVDAAKVDQIKQQIAAGNYESDSAAIADKLLSHDQSLT